MGKHNKWAFTIIIVFSLTYSQNGMINIDSVGGEPKISPNGIWLSYMSLDSNGSVIVFLNLTNNQTKLFEGSGSNSFWNTNNNKLLAYSKFYLDSNKNVIRRRLPSDDPQMNTDTNLASFVIEIDPETCNYEIIKKASESDGTWLEEGKMSPTGNIIAAEAEDSYLLLVSYPDFKISKIENYYLNDSSSPAIPSTEMETSLPSWAPDGKNIVVQSDSGIVKIDIETGIFTILLPDSFDASFPTWSPSGNYISFLIAEDDCINSHIWVMDARGYKFGLWQMTSFSGYQRFSTWTEHSDTIYFDNEGTENNGIWAIPFQHSSNIIIRKKSITNSASNQEIITNPNSYISKLNLRVFDLIGRCVYKNDYPLMPYSSTSVNSLFPLYHCPYANYLYNIEFNNKSYSGKFTKMKDN